MKRRWFSAVALVCCLAAIVFVGLKQLTADEPRSIDAATGPSPFVKMDSASIASNAVNWLLLNRFGVANHSVSGDCVIVSIRRLAGFYGDCDLGNVEIWLNTRTGLAVDPPGRRVRSLTNEQINDILARNYPYFNKDSFPQLVVKSMPPVTFVELSVPEEETTSPGYCGPDFVFRAWIDNETETVFLGEVGQ